MLASIVTFVKALPELVGLFKKLVSTVEDLVAQYKKAQEEKWIADNRELIRKIRDAKSDEERARLARDLSRHSSNMPGP